MNVIVTPQNVALQVKVNGWNMWIIGHFSVNRFSDVNNLGSLIIEMFKKLVQSE